MAARKWTGCSTLGQDCSGLEPAVFLVVAAVNTGRFAGSVQQKDQKKVRQNWKVLLELTE